MGDVSPQNSASPTPVQLSLLLEEQAQRFYRSRDNNIAERIIDQLLPMIGRTGRRYINPHRPGLSRDEVIQAGRVMVFTALRRFDPRQGTTFKTFVYNALRNQMMNYARDHGSSNITEPANSKEQRRHLKKALETSPDATVEELAEQTGMTVAAVQRVLATERSVLPTVRFGNGNDVAHGMVDPERNPAFAVDWIDAADARIMLDQAMPHLSEIQRTVITRRFFEQETLQEIASDLGYSEEGIRQIQLGALRRLRSLIGEQETLED